MKLLSVAVNQFVMVWLKNPNVTRDDKNVADLVLTNALIIDYDKIVKADIGIKMVIFLRSVKLETQI